VVPPLMTDSFLLRGRGGRGGRIRLYRTKT
jgi:hypothetical protein